LVHGDKTAKTLHKIDDHELKINIHELFIHAHSQAGGLTTGSLDKLTASSVRSLVKAACGQGCMRVHS